MMRSYFTLLENSDKRTAYNPIDNGVYKPYDQKNAINIVFLMIELYHYLPFMGYKIAPLPNVMHVHYANRKTFLS